MLQSSGEQLSVKKQILEKLKDQIRFIDIGSDKLYIPFHRIGVEIKENGITVSYCETCKSFQIKDIDPVVQQIWDYFQQDLKKLMELYREESKEVKLTKEEEREEALQKKPSK